MKRQQKTTPPRRKRLVVRMNDEEQAKIRENAKAAGLPQSEFVRRTAIDGRVIVRQQSAYGMSLVHQLRHIGINLNQLMPIAHVNGEVPPGLTAIIGKIEKLLDRIIEKF